MRYDTVDKSSATKYQIAIIFARSIPLGRVLALSKCNAPVPLSAAASRFTSRPLPPAGDLSVYHGGPRKTSRRASAATSRRTSVDVPSMTAKGVTFDQNKGENEGEGEGGGGEGADGEGVVVAGGGGSAAQPDGGESDYSDNNS
eukprot:113474-Prorocentrum_minimum.AAC.2